MLCLLLLARGLEKTLREWGSDPTEIQSSFRFLSLLQPRALAEELSLPKTFRATSFPGAECLQTLPVLGFSLSRSRDPSPTHAPLRVG